MITINNMSMPKSCADCRCTFDAFDGSTECKLGAKMIDWSKRPEDCPLVEFERPKGEWKSLTRISGKVIGECPFCNGEQDAENYCSYCGAKLYRALP